VKVVGTGPESADDWIAQYAEKHALEGRRLWVVTSDRELRRRVEAYVERIVGGGTFAGELEALGDSPD
jgi:rRNA-processing protein FCF1